MTRSGITWIALTDMYVMHLPISGRWNGKFLEQPHPMLHLRFVVFLERGISTQYFETETLVRKRPDRDQTPSEDHKLANHKEG